MGADDRRVLVVDDDPSCRELHALWLEDEYRVLRATNGEEALERVDEADIALLDREMPGMDGDAVARRIRSRAHDCFVVMVSGLEPDFDIVDLPVDDYLTKPVSRETVLDVVETIFARSVCQRLCRELLSLSARKASLERRKRPTELAESDAYRRLVANVEAKRVALGGALAEVDDEWREDLVAVVDENWRADGVASSLL